MCRMAFLIHKEIGALHRHLFVQRLGWKDTYKRVPSALKIPAVDPLVLLTLLKVVRLFPIKGFPLLCVFGGSLGEHNCCQDTLKPFYSFSKRIPNQLQISH